VVKQLLTNEARIYVTIGAIDRRSGRFQEAQTNFRRAVELDPLNFIVLMEAAATSAGMRRYDEARHFFEQALNVILVVNLVFVHLNTVIPGS